MHACRYARDLLCDLQELLDKAPVLPKDIQWHFIGHLQSNKVKAVVGTPSNAHLQPLRSHAMLLVR